MGDREAVNARGHGDANANFGATFEFFRQTGALVADEERDGLAPIDFPGSKERGCSVARLGRAEARPYSFCAMDGGGESVHTGELELHEKDRERHAREYGQMERRTGGRAKRLG